MGTQTSRQTAAPIWSLVFGNVHENALVGGTNVLDPNNYCMRMG